MKILCCVKIVADFDSQSEVGWDIVGNDIDTTYYPKQINCYDASGLELALRCAQNAAEPVELSVLTVSDGSDARFFKPLFALGAAECSIICTQRDLRFDPAWTALQLAAYAREGGFDYIIFGASQSIGRNGATGALVSALLNRPCISGVTGFEETEGGLRVSLLMDEAVLTKIVPRGSVLVIDESSALPLRSPTLKQKLAVSSRTPTIIEPYDTAQTPAAPKLLRLYREEQGGECTILPPEELAERVLALFKGESS